MKKPQLITAALAVVLVFALYKYGITVQKKIPVIQKIEILDSNISHQSQVFDSILIDAKKLLNINQLSRLELLEKSVSKVKEKQEKVNIYHQLSHFWGDSARVFEPYAWYEAEAARLENSEKKLTFAAHLFLDDLQLDELPGRRRWKALQAKDLFERSLQINPSNDSAKVGIGACYIYGNISASPMEGINKIREVAEKDSTNLFAQLTLAKGSVISGQYDKAIIRLETINRLDPENLESVLLLADMYERIGENRKAISWYKKSLSFIKRSDIRSEIEKRIETLK